MITFVRSENEDGKRGRGWAAGGLAQLVERRTGRPPTQVRFPGAARDFSPRFNFQCRLPFGVRTPPCAIAFIYISEHVKDPVVHVRVSCIMEALKHPACTLGCVARHCRSWLSPGKETRIFHGRNPIGTIQLFKKKRKRKKKKSMSCLPSCSTVRVFQNCSVVKAAYMSMTATMITFFLSENEDEKDWVKVRVASLPRGRGRLQTGKG